MSIKKEELRIGNILTFAPSGRAKIKPRMVTVMKIGDTSVVVKDNNLPLELFYNSASLQPTPITEEGLLILGLKAEDPGPYKDYSWCFREKDDQLYIGKMGDQIRCYLKNSSAMYYNDMYHEKKYIHEVQNLFFVLIGKELSYAYKQVKESFKESVKRLHVKLQQSK